MNWKVTGYSLAAIAAVIGIGCAIGMWIPWCTVGKDGCRLGVAEWAYWVAAIGSIGAWAVTIRIATNEKRDRLKRELNLALFVSGGSLLKIMEIRNISGAVGDSMTNASTKFNHAFIAWCAKRLDHMPTLEYEELSALNVLPNHLATKLVTIITDIDWCKRSIIAWSKEDQTDLENEQIEHFRSMGTRLLASRKNLAGYEKEISSFLAKHRCKIV